jgi:hypothetical protein
MFKLLPLLSTMVVPPGEPTSKDFEHALRLPEIGQHELRILAPRLLEISRITTQEQPGGWDTSASRVAMTPPLTSPQAWNFLGPFNPTEDAPNRDTLQVTVDEADVAIERVGFRRRTHYAKKDGGDLRIGHSIYLLLGESIPTGANVSVTDVDSSETKWLEDLDFSAQSLANRYSPMIHVNQVGYGATWEGRDGGATKKAYVHGFLGDLGWLLADEALGEWVVASVTLEDGPSMEDAIPVGLSLDTSFEIIDAETSAVVYQSPQNPYTVRGDSRWPTYNGVLEVDFSELVTPGNYRLRVPGFGASMPFNIGEALPKQLTRTFALGLYHNRSGQDHALPYTRFVDPPSHLAPATMPFDDEQYFFPYRNFREQSNGNFTSYDKYWKHPAPQIRSPETMLFPYVGDVVAWWPMDAKGVVAADKVVAGFNDLAYAESATIGDPFGGHPDGNAFGERPARSAYPGQRENGEVEAIVAQQSWKNPDGQGYGELGGFHGVGFINTYQIYSRNDDEEDAPDLETRATGILDTASFVIDEPWLAFLIGGSNQPYDLDLGGQQAGVTAVSLLVDGTPIRTATGSDKNLMTWKYWNVSDLQGQTASVQILDSSTTGFLLADEFMLTKREALREISSYRETSQLQGNPEFTTKQSDAVLGNSLRFDGVDDTVEAHSLDPLAATDSLTLSTWVKLETRDRDQVILSKGDDFALKFVADENKISWTVGDIEVTSPRKITNNAWHFVAATFKVGADDGLRLWVDEVDQVGSASTADLASYPHTSSILMLGGDGEQRLHGGLDDLRIRSSVVSDEELLDSSLGSGPWIDVSLGHFDAGDYSKYMINSALALHALTFTADQLLQLGAEDSTKLDNLGIPESGDGIPDVLQEAKWEADYIAKMQDTDGGFFFLVHPRGRSFETDVLPSQGDEQVVWPKTLSATGAAVGALVEIATSPSFQHHYPEDAERYLAAGLRGWDFILKGVEKYGVSGGYQRLNHYGTLAEARDEIAWAAAALFGATGDAGYEAHIIEWMPWNAEEFNGVAFAWREFRRFTWQKLYEPTGAAMRCYYFANRGARKNNSISYDETLIGPKPYHEHVRDELIGAADDLFAWAESNPYRASIPSEAKRFGSVSYFFGISDGFDLLTAHLIDPKPEYFDAIVGNLNHALGANAANRSYVSGLGWNQSHEYVSQFAHNDERQLPPTGVNIGSVNTAMPWLLEYQGLLGWNTYPPDADEADVPTPYGVYDRQTDVWNVSNEFVIPIQARAFAISAYLYQFTEDYKTAWKPAPSIEIVGTPESAEVGSTYDLTLTATGADLTTGRIVWEAPDQAFGLTSPNYTINTEIARRGWVEAEVFWPDGKRSFARKDFPVTEKVNQNIEQHQPDPVEPPPGIYGKILGNGNVRLYYPLDSDFNDAMQIVRKSPGSSENPYRLTTNGNPTFDTGNFEWPGYTTSRPDFRPLRIDASEDLLQTENRALFVNDLFPPHAEWISMEAIVFIDEFNQNGSAAYMPALDIEGLSQPVRLWIYKDPWNGPITGIYGKTQQTNLDEIIPRKTWMHLRTVMNEETTTTYMDGEVINTVPTEEFDAWLNPAYRIKIYLGGFKGFVSDLIIKAGTGAEESLGETVPSPLSSFDEWLDWQFLGETGADSLPEADPDADGRSNLLEYALGSSPHDMDRMDVPLQLLEAPSGELSLRYSRPRDEDRPDLSYAITHSTDMETWKECDPPLEVSQATEDVFGIITYQINDARLQPESTTRFLRLEVNID